MRGLGLLCCSPWGLGRRRACTGTVNYLCFSYGRQVHLNRHIHLSSLSDRSREGAIQLKGFGNPSFNTGIWSGDRFLHWLDSPISVCIPHQPSLVIWRQYKAWCTVIVSIGQAEENSSGTWWKGDGKGEEYCCFSPQLNCLSNPSQRVTQFICLKSIRSSQCESLSRHKTGPLIILFCALSPGCSRLSLIFSYFKSIIIFYRARAPPPSEIDVLFIQCLWSLSLSVATGEERRMNRTFLSVEH